MFNSERKQIELFAKIEQEMGQLSGGTVEVRTVVQELRSDVHELRHLMFEHNTATKERLAGLKKRQDGFLSA